MAKATKYVYSFGNGRAEGKGHQRTLLGGKGAGLAEMTHIGLPVPAGFTIATDCCEAYYKHNRRWPRGLEKQVREGLKKLERTCKKKLGDRKDPLLVSVRSGAAASMPGMMETILNLGLTDESVEGLAQVSGNRRFALDAYRRFIMMYGSTACGMQRSLFDDEFEHIKEHYSRPRLNKPEEQKVSDTEVNEEELLSLIRQYKELYRKHTAQAFPQDPFQQLIGAINAVFGSWEADKAITYRRVEGITDLHGTAVNVVQMVFGNMGDDSGTGVCFTRNPSTGSNEFYGDLLINAQGEDVVAGVRTPVKLSELKTLMPDAYDQLEAVRVILELHYEDMQDLEFTIERGKLYMLQCRSGKRSPVAAFKIAVDQATKALASKSQVSRLVRQKMLPKTYATRATKPVITREQAINRIKGEDIERLFFPVIDPQYSSQELRQKLLAVGINAVPGAAKGKIVFNAADAEEAVANGDQVILVRKETSPEDVGGMHAASGILTATGGKTSHAAVVARGWGKCCVVGCESLRIDYDARTMTAGGQSIAEGEYITLNGSSGEVFIGELPLVKPDMPNEYHTLMNWCDQNRTLRVRTNADTPADAKQAIEFGAEGIGLCRTEHMFFETEQRRLAMQEMIVSDNTEDRERALRKLLPYQRDDFIGIFEAMDGRPVNIRLVDPPLHEFLPHSQADMKKLSTAAGISVAAIENRAEQLREANPMLGHRGCRLSITYPEILDMQVTAIIEAAVACQRQGVTVRPEIMIPLVIDAYELELLAKRAREVADRILSEAGERVTYTVGTMVETPRAALLGDQIADVADFISFGTNDLTQTTMALSRDDAGRFLPDYIDKNKAAIFSQDPFQSIDVQGVGLLMNWCVDRGRNRDRQLKVGICGEHGGDPPSVGFCHRIGLDYVSCSPFRVPVARLAAAQASLEQPRTRRSVTKKTAKKKKSAKTSATRKKKSTGKRAASKSTGIAKRKVAAKKRKKGRR